MIDCSKTENYFIEKSRMTKQQKNGICKLDCTDCPLSSSNNGTGISCSHFETGYPGKAIAIMQKWSDEHPQKTYLSELLEHFPNVPLTTTEIPEDICPFHLGFMSKDDCRNDRNCIKCWNQPIKNNEEGEEND
jgi:hypothetical protein